MARDSQDDNDWVSKSVAKSSMYEQHFERWSELMRQISEYGKRIMSGNYVYLDAYYSCLRQLYMELKPLLDRGGSNAELLVSNINSCFKQVVAASNKLSKYPGFNFDKGLVLARKRLLNSIVKNLTDISGFLFECIQEVGLGVHTTDLMSEKRIERQMYDS